MNNGESGDDLHFGIDFPTIVESNTDGLCQSTGELDLYTKRCEHLLGGSEFSPSLGIRRISQADPQTYQQLANSLQEVTGRYINRIMRIKQNSSKKYISNVLVYRNDQHRQRVLKRLRTSLLDYPGDIFLWVDEGDHLHIVHDCAYSNGTCRCRVLQGEDFRGYARKPMRRIKSIRDLDEIDWTNVILYFIMGKRSCEAQVWLDGRVQRPPSSSEIVRWEDLRREWQGLVERGDETLGRDARSQASDYEDGGQHFSEGSETSTTKRRRTYRPVPAKRTKFEKISEAVGQLLSKYYCVPAVHIKDILVSTEETKFLFDPSNEKYFQASCNYFCQQYNHYTFYDFYKLYQNCTPVFYANNINPWEYYHNREDSFKFVNDLLLFQYNNNIDEIKCLLNNIRDWFNRKGWAGNNKVNAICITGTHNCGKNYFWDSVHAIALNVGTIGRVNNKTNTFALQEAYSKRIVVGNEVSMEEGAKEDFKKLCEGTAFNIKVKFQGDKIFTKTPVLLIANYMLDICYDIHFKDVRLKTYVWKQCNMLKASNKKPYPLVIFDLFEYYNIDIQ